ncbi:glycosyltransferase family 17 protein [Acidomonas methanolica]|uniref:N-acetylglucosaminyltransferase n=1 Tax=Acidomonas methanolica NBRC 104435 TaxID=1231351 RepID=A0A023D845_ACIMT|nr:hypothetical protein [Acidomonas methanolica]MBU2655585.1 hypothetical protein [Acidomonas methanolica]TCS16850.1 glycosyl transferase family 17 [Acidomonas methanolica]GAJ29976.1 N-acetylglucosaminyltransferase [Acidomonas methanolica NBRC 104435]GBQ47961.1 N-acetylglucosaminyltransferase [Acidomonas methanolica]GEL00773.1 hypothetical protein AME01nite_32710 [Acidomonas methanolica NBRC 104435]
MSKIFNCFPFFNELDILDIKFAQEYQHVDYFVISESTKDFMGRPKALMFSENMNRYAQYLDKVIHLVVDDMPDSSDPFEREYHQRHSLLRIASQAADEDVFIISDADEILREEAIETIRNLNGIAVFDMSMFQFYINLRQSPSGWKACYAASNRFLKCIEHISKFRWDRNAMVAVLDGGGIALELPDAGWHFTHLGGIEALKIKFNSYSHANDPWPRLMKNGNNLYKHIVAGGIVGNLKERAEFIPISYPYYPLRINDNQSEYLGKGFIKDPYVALRELQGLYKQALDEVARIFRNNENPLDLLYGLPAQNYAWMADIALDDQ